MRRMNEDSKPRISRTGTATDADQACRRVEAEALFAGAQVVEIAFRGERYFLRMTRAGKLILTK